ncbi:sirq protein [Ophiostoma piceae UAMH 11346]|uniref:Sirq protein n=1 Tax=Ophiostoma piceae (strain UAMH 11346) TaxID=1262450 RepID=S3CFM8_OPHP1|nr:sirq protein [Ophiostoma piceae UAMH 11346]
MSKYALVFGASGVTGWSMVNELLHDYPRPGVWGGVVALTNRPLSLAQSHWPADDKRLSIVSGIDLLQGSTEDVEAAIKDKVPHLDKITDVFYLAYKAHTDAAQQDTENVEMLKRAAVACDRLCPKLENFVLQTGAKHYGCHLLGNRPAHLKPPFAETAPPLEGEAAEGLFYLPQMAFLTEYAQTKAWGWIDTRPDVVVGFVPNENFFSLGSSLGFFLSLYREINGEGAACPFPGTAASWVTKSNDSSAEMIARQTIAVSLSDKYRGTKGESFNVADERTPRTWETRWPDLCACFGLEGVKAEQDNPIEVRAYIREHMKAWEAMEAKYGLQKGYADHPRIFPGFEFFLIALFDQDREYDMGKMYGPEGAGFTEERDTTQAWGRVFEHMRAARILPTV